MKRAAGNLDSNGDFGQTMYLSAPDNNFRNEQFGIRLIDFDLTVLENFVFDGSTDADWSTADNWSSGTSPDSAGARVVFAGDNGTQTSADLNGGSFTVGELQVIDPATANSIQSSSASSVLTLSPSSIGIVMSDATSDFTFDGTTGEAWTLALGSSQTWNVDSTETSGDLIGDSGVTIDLGGNTLTTNVGAGREVSIAGEVTGSGGITKTGAGTTTLSGTNTYTGATTVSAGTLQVGSSQALGLNPDVKVSDGVLKLDGNSITIGGLTGAGKNDGSAAVINDNASIATLTVGGGNASASFGGVIGDGATGGALSLTKTGTGTQTLTAANTYTGVTTINGGKLTVSGTGSINGTSGVSIGAGEFNYNSSGTLSQDVSFSTTGGILSGTGTMGNAINVTTGNTLAIGNSTGTMNFVSHLTVTGTYEFELNGGMSDADLGNVGGDLILGGILDLVQLGTYTEGDKFTLFSYAGALTGEFTGLADDTTFTDADGTWLINYDDSMSGSNGGTQINFVTITAIPEPSAYALLSLGVLGLCARRRR